MLSGLSLRVVESILLGVAVGDSLGLPLEYEWRPPAPEWLAPSLGELRCVVRRGRCAYSDDTEMTLILAESIAGSCGVDQDDFALRLIARAQIEDEVRYYGAGTIALVKLVRKGVPWRTAAIEVYDGGNMGNGAAIRVAPVAIFYHPDANAVARAAGLQAAVTHAHPLGVEAARLQALGIHYSLEGVEPGELPGLLAGHAESSEARSRLEAAASLLEGDPSPSEVVEALGNGPTGYETVAAAVYSHARAGGDPLTALFTALSLGGDSDSIASMAVALSAAYAGGLGGLEEASRAVEGLEDIREASRRLYEAKLECGPR